MNMKYRYIYCYHDYVVRMARMICLRTYNLLEKARVCPRPSRCYCIAYTRSVDITHHGDPLIRVRWRHVETLKRVIAQFV
jgi:hypothetical protein